MINRRTVLTAIGAAGATALAGCGGDGNGDDGNGDGGGSDDGGAPTQPGQTTPEPATDAGDDTGGGADGCPSEPASYERQPVPPGLRADESAVSVEAPANDDVVTTSPTTVSLEYDPHRINLRVRILTDTDVDTVFSNPDLEVTEEYDLPSGARMTKQTEFEGQESARVYLPRGDDVVMINTEVESETCLDALGPIHDHMVNSLEVL